MPLPAGDDGGTLLLTTLDVVHDSVVLSLRDLRTLVGVGVEGVSALKSATRSHLIPQMTYPTLILLLTSVNFFENSS